MKPDLDLADEERVAQKTTKNEIHEWISLFLRGKIRKIARKGLSLI